MIAAGAALAAWQALAIVGGGIVVGALGLTALAHVPGGRWVFNRLVVDPLRGIVRELVTVEVHRTVEEAVDAHVTTKLAPIADAIESINVAVNHVAPGAPALKDRVTRIEQCQLRIEGQLVVIRDVVERLVQRP